MKLLLLTFFYPPDLSACAFRAGALVRALQDVAPPGTTIDVVTTAPNRYASFSANAPHRETHGSVTITRFPVPEHRGGVADQTRAFIAYARAATSHIGTQHYDAVFATSSRLMTAAFGAYTAGRLKTRLYLDIRDIIADTIADVVPGVTGRFASPVLATIERRTIRRADRVNLVSRGFESYFRSRYPGQEFTYLTNGIDDEFLAAAPTARSSPRGDRLRIVYAGNLGEGQGLHLVVPQLAARLASRADFTVIGDGGRKRALEDALAAAGVTNVALRPPVPRDQLLEVYQSADVLFLHLNAYEAFERVLPSKLFEYAALGKPIWAGVAGYAAEFIRAEIDNAAVFAPCDVDGAMRAFGQLSLETAPRPRFIERFARANIMREMARDIVRLASGA